MNRGLVIVGGVLAVIFISGTSATAASLITSANIKDGTIQSVDIMDGTVTHNDIKDGTVGSTEIWDGSLQSIDVKDGALTGTDIKDGSIGLADLDSATKARLLPAGVLVAVLSSESCPSGTSSAGSIVGQEFADYFFGRPTTVIDTFTSAFTLDGLNTKQNPSASMTKLTLCRTN